jgi:uncharacterized membrane protein
MPASQSGWTDEQVEQLVGRLLQFGVLLAALVVLLGGIVYLVRHGLEPPEHHVFRGEPPELRGLWRIGTSAAEFHSRGIIQLGLVLLIATPVARVILTVVSFWRQRDYVYVGITLIVLAVLLFSLMSGH